MKVVTLLLVAIALGTDAMSVAIGIGMKGISRRNIIILSGVISVFHVIMPLIGLYLGSILGVIIGQYAAMIGAAILVFIGLQMVWNHLPSQSNQVMPWPKKSVRLPASLQQGFVATFSNVTVLAGSVSLDALSVGFSLGTVQVNLMLTVIIMGLVAGIMTAVGLMFGRRLGGWLGENAGVIGGVILIGIGIKMLVY